MSNASLKFMRFLMQPWMVVNTQKVDSGTSFMQIGAVLEFYMHMQKVHKVSNAHFLADVHYLVGGSNLILDMLFHTHPEIARSIAPGHLIVLKCDPRVLVLRLAGRDKTYNVEQLSLHIEAINRMWSEQSATIIDTTNLSQSQVVKKVLEIILFRPYKPIDFQQICQSKTIEVAA